jgi:hypothetical protein
MATAYNVSDTSLDSQIRPGSNGEVFMRLVSLALILAGALTAGCTSQSIDCSRGVGHNGCIPGTIEYDEMARVQRDAKTTAEIDDARCQAFGRRGTPGYLDCRRRAAEDQPLLKPVPSR